MKNTGLMLSETKGPLKNLLDNLSGENGNYWLIALKKMLRKERVPKLSSEDLKLLMVSDSKQVIEERLVGWVNALKSIPVVEEVRICSKEEVGDLIDIGVFSNIRTFYYGRDEEIDYPLFVITTDFKVRHSKDDDGLETDKIYEGWKKDEYPDIYSFYKALIELSVLYKNAIPMPVSV